MGVSLISVFNHKGGTGKSSTVCMLSYAFERSVTVGLIDFDPQRTLTSLTEINETFKLPLLENVSKPSQIAKLSQRVIIVDMPPYIIDGALDILKASNLVIMPCKPSIVDAVATIKTYEYIQDNTEVKAVCLLNMVQKSTTITNEVKNVLKEQGVPLLNAALGQRVVYAKALSYGTNIYKAGNRLAVAELDQLAQEILTHLI